MRASKSSSSIQITHSLGSSFLLLLMAFLFSVPTAAQTAMTQTPATSTTEARTVAAPDVELRRASFAIANPKNLKVPEPRAQALHQIVQDVVADYLHVRHKKQAPPLLLVLGGEKEHFTFGGLNQVDTIYLETWNEEKFVATDVSLAVQRLLAADGLNRLVEEISHRSDRLLPVSLDELRKGSVSEPNPQLPAMGNPCLAAMTDASQIGMRCEPRPAPLP